MTKTVSRRSTAQWRKNDISGHADYLHVIGAGLPRTGTSSLKEALEILGFDPCHHMTELFDKRGRSEEFIRAYRGEKVDFFGLMKGYGSTVDAPTTDFYKQIHQAYPKAKIVLTVRDSDEKWFESFEDTIGILATNNTYYYIIYLFRFLRLQATVTRLFYKKWQTEFGPITPKFHSFHNAKVLKENKAGDVLVFNVKEGWDPLCKFLGVDVPQDIPFPNVNERNNIKRMIRMITMIGFCSWILLGAIIFGAIYIIIKFAM